MSSDEATGVKTRRTRASTFSPVWTYFTKGNKNGQFYEATCVFCSHKFTWGKAGEMINHIRSKCKMATAEAKAESELMESPSRPRKSTDLYSGSGSVQEALAAFARTEVKTGSPLVPRSSQSVSGRRARPRKPVWNFFHVGKAYHNSHSAKCRYCGKEYAAGIPETMVNHIVKSCPLAPVEIREAFIVDPSGEKAVELNAENSVFNADFEVEWDLNEENPDAVTELLTVEDQSEPSGSKDSFKKIQKTLAEGRKPGTGQAGMGRSRNTVWEHFNTGVKRGYFYEIFCKYCGYSNQTGVPVKMIEHLKTKCPSVPEDVKKEKFYRPERRSEGPPTLQSNGYPTQASHQVNSDLRSGFESESGNVDVVTRAVGFATLAKSAKRTVSPEVQVAVSSRNKRIQRVFRSAPNVPAVSVDGRPTSGLGVDKEKFHQSLSRYFIMTGSSASLLEHPAFRQILLNLNPTVEIPSPQYFSEVILECEIIRVESLTESCVEAAVFVTMGITLIEDANSCPVLIILVFCIDENGRKRSFVRSVDMIPDSRAAAADFDRNFSEEDVFRWVNERINEQIEQIGPKKIVAVVQFGEKKLASNLPRHVAEVPCLLHYFQNLLDGIFKQKFFLDVFDSCQQIASFINTDVAVQEKISENEFSINLKKCTTKMPMVMLEFMQSVLHHQIQIRKKTKNLFGEFDETSVEGVDFPFVLRFIESDEFWHHLEGIINVVAPLVSAVTMARNETITLGDAFYFLLAYGKRLSSGSRRGVAALPVEVNRFCVSNLNTEFAKIDSPIFRLSYLLHPLYRGDGLFDCLPDDLLLEAGEWSKSMARTADQTVTMIRQLRRFKSRLPPFNETFRANENPINFWQRLSSSAGLELRQLAIRLLAICPTNSISGPDWNSTTLQKKCRFLTPEILAKIIQLQHFYHCNVEEEFKDLKTVFGSESNQEKMAELMKIEEEFSFSEKFSKNFPLLKNERPDSDMSDEEEEPSLYLDKIADFSNQIFDNFPKSWILQKPTLKREESPVAPSSSEEYDVRQLLLEIDEDS